MLTSMRCFGMNDLAEIARMTLYEYEMRMTAYQLKQVDREYEIHLQAWANWNVQAMKSQGKRKKVPVFKTFRQFFDYEQCIHDVLKGMDKGDKALGTKKKGLVELLKKQKERRQGDGREL